MIAALISRRQLSNTLISRQTNSSGARSPTVHVRSRSPQPWLLHMNCCIDYIRGGIIGITNTGIARCNFLHYNQGPGSWLSKAVVLMSCSLHMTLAMFVILCVLPSILLVSLSLLLYVLPLLPLPIILFVVLPPRVHFSLHVLPHCYAMIQLEITNEQQHQRQHRHQQHHGGVRSKFSEVVVP